MNCLYSKVSDSFCCPKLVLVSVLRAFSFLSALVQMFEMWVENVRWVSRVTPNTVGVLLRGRGWLWRMILGCIFDSLRSEVKRVTVDFCGEAVILFSVSHLSKVVM